MHSLCRFERNTVKLRYLLSYTFYIMKKILFWIWVCFALFIANIYADSANSDLQDMNTIIGTKKYHQSLFWYDTWNFSMEYSQFTSPSLGITFKYISSGEDALWFTGRQVPYRLNNIICLGIKPTDSTQYDQKVWCIEVFNTRPKAASYVKENNIWRKINLKNELRNWESDLIHTTVHKIIGKKLRYLTYDMEWLAPGPDYSWIRTIRAIKRPK